MQLVCHNQDQDPPDTGSDHQTLPGEHSSGSPAVLATSAAPADCTSLQHRAGKTGIGILCEFEEFRNIFLVEAKFNAYSDRFLSQLSIEL